jgi:hypothetical protein
MIRRREREAQEGQEGQKREGQGGRERFPSEKGLESSGAKG